MDFYLCHLIRMIRIQLPSINTGRPVKITIFAVSQFHGTPQTVNRAAKCPLEVRSPWKKLAKLARLGAISIWEQLQKKLHFSKLLSRVQLWSNWGFDLRTLPKLWELYSWRNFYFGPKVKVTHQNWGSGIEFLEFWQSSKIKAPIGPKLYPRKYFGKM